MLSNAQGQAMLAALQPQRPPMGGPQPGALPPGPPQGMPPGGVPPQGAMAPVGGVPQQPMLQTAQPQSPQQARRLATILRGSAQPPISQAPQTY